MFSLSFSLRFIFQLLSPPPCFSPEEEGRRRRRRRRRRKRRRRKMSIVDHRKQLFFFLLLLLLSLASAELIASTQTSLVSFLLLLSCLSHARNEWRERERERAFVAAWRRQRGTRVQNKDYLDHPKDEFCCCCCCALTLHLLSE